MISLPRAVPKGADGSPPFPSVIRSRSRLTIPTLRGCIEGTKISRGRRSTRPPRVANMEVQIVVLIPCCSTKLWYHSPTDPTRRCRQNRGPGSLVKDPSSTRQDEHTRLVWSEKTRREHDPALSGSTFSCFPLEGRDRPAVPLRYTHRSQPHNPPGDPRRRAKTRAKRGPCPPAGRSQHPMKKPSKKIPEASVRCPRHIRFRSSQRKVRYKSRDLTPRAERWYSQESQVGYPNHSSITPNESRDRPDIGYCS